MIKRDTSSDGTFGIRHGTLFATNVPARQEGKGYATLAYKPAAEDRIAEEMIASFEEGEHPLFGGTSLCSEER